MTTQDFLLTLRDAIAREPGLTRHTFWDANGTPCALGSLKPRAERINPLTEYHLDNPNINPLHYEFNNEIHELANRKLIVDIAWANNTFEGTPEARRDYMLSYLESQLTTALTTEVTQEVLVS